MCFQYRCSYVLILFGAVCRIVVLGCRGIDRGLAALAVLALVAIGTRHRLGSRARVHMSGMTRWQHGTGMSGYGRVSILMREGLEVHGLGWIHFLAEAEQMERSIGADLIFHALREESSISNSSTCSPERIVWCFGICFSVLVRVERPARQNGLA